MLRLSINLQNKGFFCTCCGRFSDLRDNCSLGLFHFHTPPLYILLYFPTLSDHDLIRVFLFWFRKFQTMKSISDNFCLSQNAHTGQHVWIIYIPSAITKSSLIKKTYTITCQIVILQINNNPALVPIMAWRRSSHYLNQCWPSSLTHICGTSGRWDSCYVVKIATDMILSLLFQSIQNLHILWEHL